MNKPVIDVLLIDDDQSFVEVMPLIFYTIAKSDSQKFKIEVIGFTDPVEAMQKVLSLELKVDLMILDIMMPDLNGIELCRIFKNDASTSHIPIMFLTGLPDPARKYQALEAGAQAYYTKPANVEDLYSAVVSLYESNIDQNT